MQQRRPPWKIGDSQFGLLNPERTGLAARASGAPLMHLVAPAGRLAFHHRLTLRRRLALALPLAPARGFADGNVGVTVRLHAAPAHQRTDARGLAAHGIERLVRGFVGIQAGGGVAVEQLQRGAGLGPPIAVDWARVAADAFVRRSRWRETPSGQTAHFCCSLPSSISSAGLNAIIASDSSRMPRKRRSCRVARRNFTSGRSQNRA